MTTFADELVRAGALNSVSMLTLKMTSPGVPDIYQGNELIDLSLVDPDNRRAVDYERRSQMLDELESVLSASDKRARLSAMMARPEDGRLKFWVTWRLLQLRAAEEDLLRDGGYEPLAVTGPSQRRVVAFARVLSDQRLYAVVGRFHSRGRTDAAVPDGALPWSHATLTLPTVEKADRLMNWLTGETIAVSTGHVDLAPLFATMPFAVLVAQE